MPVRSVWHHCWALATSRWRGKLTRHPALKHWQSQKCERKVFYIIKDCCRCLFISHTVFIWFIYVCGVLEIEGRKERVENGYMKKKYSLTGAPKTC